MSATGLCRLNFRLSTACHETIQEKCADACGSKSVDQPCGGTVLRCLTERLEEITDAECKKEVFYFVKMEARAGCSLRVPLLHPLAHAHVHGLPRRDCCASEVGARTNNHSAAMATGSLRAVCGKYSSTGSGLRAGTTRGDAGFMRTLLRVQVRDFRNDVILAEACHSDVEKLCKSEPAGTANLPKALHAH